MALLLVCFGAWWVIAAAELVEPYLVPSPGATLDVLTGKADYLWQHTWVTTYETLLGFLIAVVVGVAAAVIMVYSTTVERTLYPILLFAQVVPKIAIAPLFVVWLGFGIAPKILIAVLIAFFPVVISMVTGLKAVDPEMLQLSSTMGANSWQTFVKIRFPASSRTSSPASRSRSPSPSPAPSSASSSVPTRDSATSSSRPTAISTLRCSSRDCS